MVQQRIKAKTPALPNLPLAGADSEQAKYMIAATLAAGKDGCTCEACQLLKRFGGELSRMLLQEVSHGGDQHPE